MSTSVEKPSLKHRKPQSSGSDADTSDHDDDHSSKSQTHSRSHSQSHHLEADHAPTVGFLDVLRVALGIALLSCTLSYFLTGDSFTWGFQPEWSRWTNIRMLWNQPIYLTDAELALYNGTDPDLPIYLSINDTIFDVTKGASKYGPGGSYSFFAGRDATRAYVTGCFQDDLTWDIRGVEDMFEGDVADPKESVRKAIDHWVKFFHKNDKYFFVGYTVHPENWEENTPIRELCQAAGGREKREKRIARERREKAARQKKD